MLTNTRAKSLLGKREIRFTFLEKISKQNN
jgi:hypothetical protein